MTARSLLLAATWCTLWGIVANVVHPPKTFAAGADNPTVHAIWPDGPPDSNGLTGEEVVQRHTSNISRPTIAVHLPPPETKTNTAIVIVPGGGYQCVCHETEGQQIADILVPRGIAAIVLKYRLPNQHHRIPANDARRAIRLVRYHAHSWNIRADRIGVWGFSAGGHLASTVSTVFDAGDPAASDPVERHSSRPDFSILFYPVISMQDGIGHLGSRTNLLGPHPSVEQIQHYSNELRVSAETPPTFLLHAADDDAVPVENSLRYYRSLTDHGVKGRLLVYESGRHGPPAFHDNPSWLPNFEEWLARVSR